MDSSILGQFPLPQKAVEDLGRQRIQDVPLGDGVSRLMAGHDRGVPFRFVRHGEYNPTKSKAKRYEAFDDYVLIEWTKDRKNKYTERVQFLPPGLLEFEVFEEEVPREDGKGTKKVTKYGECIGGRYKEAYDRFIGGTEAPGTPLRVWGVFTEGQTATLEKMSFFTVEQFAEAAPNRIKNLPPEFHQFQERARQFIASKEGRWEVDKQGEEILALTARLDALEKENAELRTPKKRGKKAETEGALHA